MFWFIVVSRLTTDHLEETKEMPPSIVGNNDDGNDDSSSSSSSSINNQFSSNTDTDSSSNESDDEESNNISVETVEASTRRSPISSFWSNSFRDDEEEESTRHYESSSAYDSFENGEGILFSVSAPDNNTAGSTTDRDQPTSSSAGATIGEGEAIVSTGRERQQLILMLLANLCALHDPTPRTFIVHVLGLFEKGIVDREAIRFLFHFGFVPSGSDSPLSPPHLLTASATPLPASPSKDKENRDDADADGGESQAIVPYGRSKSGELKSGDLVDIEMMYRAVEASAIRSSLAEQHPQKQQQQKQQQRNHPNVPSTTTSTSPKRTATLSPTYNRSSSEPYPPQHKASSSWEVAHHPLFFSRYQRDFDQSYTLASGSFGQVFRATKKMDGREYAVKRVTFSEKGYSSKIIDTVWREVRCLAQCDHPHCVRYYTSWYEPTWMTGSGQTISSVNDLSPQGAHKMLTDVQKMVVNGDGVHGGAEPLLEDVNRLKTESRGGATRRNSFGTWHSDEEGLYDSDSDYSDWTDEYAKDDSHLLESTRRRNASSRRYSAHNRNGCRSSVGGSEGVKKKSSQSEKKATSYRYQICLYIQMQLCSPTTLADWIRQRNHLQKPPLAVRTGTAVEIFRQIVLGMAHVHGKDIVHRDMKPANIFAAKEDLGEGDSIVFKIGDFGLSKLLHDANFGKEFDDEAYIHHPQQSHTTTTTTTSTTGRVGGNEGHLLLPPALTSETSTNKADTATTAWHDPLTAGVGTASYAAPEQIISQTYGSEADIFSLGLILLELFCEFGTEHERLDTFNECRNARTLPSWLNEDFPEAASIILACTDPEPIKRPAAAKLLRTKFLEVKKTSNVHHSKELEDLRMQLVEKEELIQHQQLVISEKDRIIAKLRKQIKGNPEKGEYTFNGDKKDTKMMSTTLIGTVESSSFSDDEDDY